MGPYCLQEHKQMTEQTTQVVTGGKRGYWSLQCWSRACPKDIILTIICWRCITVFPNRFSRNHINPNPQNLYPMNPTSFNPSKNDTRKLCFILLAQVRRQNNAQLKMSRDT